MIKENFSLLGIEDFVNFMFIELEGKQLESNYLSLEGFNFYIIIIFFISFFFNEIIWIFFFLVLYIAK